jgi:hypothetical protein
MKITKKLLINNGFVENYNKYTYEYEYGREVALKHNPECIYFLRIYEGSNTNGRDWWINVDNDLHMTCGNVDLNTVEHFNTFMDLLDLDFKL